MHQTKVFLLLSSVLLLWQCTNSAKEYELELMMIDSLETQLSQARSAMDIDPNIIEDRKDQMQYNMNTIKLYYTDTFTNELAFTLDKYRGIHKLYSVFLDRYEKIVAETDTLDLRLKKLKNSLLKEHFDRATFREYYKEEKNDVGQNLSAAQDIGTKVFDVEREYTRIGPEVDALVNTFDPSKKE